MNSYPLYSVDCHDTTQLDTIQRDGEMKRQRDGETERLRDEKRRKHMPGYGWLTTTHIPHTTHHTPRRGVVITIKMACGAEPYSCAPIPIINLHLRYQPAQPVWIFQTPNPISIWEDGLPPHGWRREGGQGPG